MSKSLSKTTRVQNVARVLLGSFMLLAGIGHLSFLRKEFQAQVPDWIPIDKDTVVVLSGIVEISFGAAMIAWKKQRRNVGIALAVFYVLIFPGNIAQYTEHRDAFGLDSDTARLTRLFFQPVLIVLALWSTGVLSRKKTAKHFS